jgi:hypothetical protein
MQPVTSPSTSTFSVDLGSGTTVLSDCDVVFQQPAGCLCVTGDGSQSCIAGEWDGSNNVVVRPIARWKLDQNGPKIVDAIGNYDGHASGSGWLNATAVNGSYFGVNFVDFGDIPAMNFGTEDFTIAFDFLALPLTSDGYASMISKTGGSCDYGSYWVVQMYPSDELSFELHEDNVGDVVLTTTVGYRDGFWHHVIAARSGNQLVLNVDGLLYPSGNIAVLSNINISSAFSVELPGKRNCVHDSEPRSIVFIVVQRVHDIACPRDAGLQSHGCVLFACQRKYSAVLWRVRLHFMWQLLSL